MFQTLVIRIIFIIKKNHSVLKKLRDWFSQIPGVVQSRNLLVIDDEADHATVNTASPLPEDYDEEEEESPDLSVTNEYLRQILQQSLGVLTLGIRLLRLTL